MPVLAKVSHLNVREPAKRTAASVLLYASTDTCTHTCAHAAHTDIHKRTDRHNTADHDTTQRNAL